MGRPRQEELTGEQETFARLSARGFERDEIIKKMYGITKEGDPSRFHSIECNFTRWRNHPKFFDAWMDEVRHTYSMKLMSKGLRKIYDQMDDDEKWISNKAANDAINFAKARLFAEEDNKVVIEFTNGAMPEIGVPEQDEEEE